MLRRWPGTRDMWKGLKRDEKGYRNMKFKLFEIPRDFPIAARKFCFFPPIGHTASRCKFGSSRASLWIGWGAGGFGHSMPCVFSMLWPFEAASNGNAAGEADFSFAGALPLWRHLSWCPEDQPEITRMIELKPIRSYKWKFWQALLKTWGSVNYGCCVVIVIVIHLQGLVQCQRLGDMFGRDGTQNRHLAMTWSQVSVHSLDVWRPQRPMFVVPCLTIGWTHLLVKSDPNATDAIVWGLPIVCWWWWCNVPFAWRSMSRDLIHEISGTRVVSKSNWKHAVTVCNCSFQPHVGMSCPIPASQKRWIRTNWIEGAKLFQLEDSSSAVAAAASRCLRHITGLWTSKLGVRCGEEFRSQIDTLNKSEQFSLQNLADWFCHLIAMSLIDPDSAVQKEHTLVWRGISTFNEHVMVVKWACHPKSLCYVLSCKHLMKLSIWLARYPCFPVCLVRAPFGNLRLTWHETDAD